MHSVWVAEIPLFLADECWTVGLAPPPGRACRVAGGAARQDQVQRQMPKFFLIHGFTVAFRIVCMHLHILDLYPAGTNYSSDFPSSLIVSWTMTDANLGVRKMSRALRECVCCCVPELCRFYG